MYVVEILERCGDLAARTGRVYRSLAERSHGDQERARLWRELALEEETHADVLRRELRAFQEQEQSGTFLPEFAERLQKLDSELVQLEHRAATAQTFDDALAVAVALEQADLEDLYDDLVLQGEPAFKLLAERIEGALGSSPQPSSAAGLGRPPRRERS